MPRRGPDETFLQVQAEAKAVGCILVEGHRSGYILRYGPTVTWLPSGELHQFSDDNALLSFHGSLKSVRERLAWLALPDKDKNIDDPPPVIVRHTHHLSLCSPGKRP